MKTWKIANVALSLLLLIALAWGLYEFVQDQESAHAKSLLVTSIIVYVPVLISTILHSIIAYFLKPKV